MYTAQCNLTDWFTKYMQTTITLGGEVDYGDHHNSDTFMYYKFYDICQIS